MTAGPEAPARLTVNARPGGAIDRTRLAIVALRLSAVFCIVAGVTLALAALAPRDALSEALAQQRAILWLPAVLCFALAFGVRAVVQALRMSKPWAWRAALLLCVLYLPTLFVPLGALGLFALLSAGTRARFHDRRH